VLSRGHLLLIISDRRFDICSTRLSARGIGGCQGVRDDLIKNSRALVDHDGRSGELPRGAKLTQHLKKLKGT
jgi:hypothetical protein